MSTDQPGDGPRILIAGGGSAGHVQPALAVADAIVAIDPTARITCLGTEGGLETRLVPERGYDLELIGEVKFTRKIDSGLVKLPFRLRSTVKAARKVLRDKQIDVVVGFGGYVALPAYLAARGRLPIIVHDSNARAGIANRIGARFATVVAAAVPDSGLAKARVVGNPVRKELTGLDRGALREQARRYFGLDPDAPTLVIVGGSLGAVRFNETFPKVARELGRAGIGVLHVHGKGKPVELPEPEPGVPPYVALPYIDRMDYAYAAADLLVARSGAMTVAEIGAVKVPVVYVPLAFGNGEQALNAGPQVQAGSAKLIAEADLTPEAVGSQIIPLLTDPAALAAMESAAASSQTAHADEVLARIALAAAHHHRKTGK